MNENIVQPTKRGDRITAKGYSELVRRSKRKVTGHDVVETAYGWHIRQRREDEKRILVLNSSGFTVPAFGIVEITGFDSDKNKLIIGRPTSDDDPNTFIVAGADISNGSEGYVFDDKGTHQILAPGAVRDDIVGSQTGSFDGAVSVDGSYLVRAVSGGDVFATPFRGAAPGLDLIEFSEYSEIRQTNPDDNFNHPNFAAAFTNSPSTGSDSIGIIKLASPVGAIADDFTHIILGFASLMDFRVIGPGILFSHFKLEVFKITEDFDASAVTFNSYATLSKSLAAIHQFWRVDGSDSASFLSGDGTGITQGRTHEIGIIDNGSNKYYEIDLTNARGLGLELSIGTFSVSSTLRSAQLNFTKSGVGGSPANARGFIMRAF